MSFLKLSPEPSKKESSSLDTKVEERKVTKPDSRADLIGFDLLYELSYLAALSAAGIPRGQLFQLAGELNCSTSHYFREIDQLARNMNYQYSEACRMVGESAKQPDVKSLLLRLSSSLATGESLEDFTEREVRVQADSYVNEYDRKLETLKKWTDAYIAMQISVALIIVVGAISTVIYDMGTTFVTGLVMVMIVISVMSAWMIYRTAPLEVKILSGPDGIKSQRTTKTTFMILVPAALVVGAFLGMMKMPIGAVFAVMGLIVFPVGIVSHRFDKRVDKKDKDVTTFLRAIGATASAIGTTPMEAMGRLDKRSIGSLASSVSDLQTMLRSSVSPVLCWHRFVMDNGSELVARSVRIFMDGITFGGDAEEVGSKTSLLTLKVNFMREKRLGVASSFKWLAIAMHVVIVFLLIFVIEVVSGFGDMVQAAGLQDIASGGSSVGAAISFNFANLAFLRWLLIPVVLVMSVVNAIAPQVAEGGHGHKMFYNLGITLFTGGMAMVIAPRLASMIFQIVPAA